jgi:hypothetical protein
MILRLHDRKRQIVRHSLERSLLENVTETFHRPTQRNYKLILNFRQVETSACFIGTLVHTL